MIFPPMHCVHTSNLTEDTYPLLITKLKKDGYVNLVPHLSYQLVIMWDYIGIATYDDINVWTNPYSFMPPNSWGKYLNVKDEDYPNLLTKEWLEEYLK